MLVMLLESSNDMEADPCCAGTISLWWCQRRRQNRHDGSQSRGHTRGSVSPAGRVPGAGHRVQRRSPRPRSVHRDIPPVSGKRGDRYRGYRRANKRRQARKAIDHYAAFWKKSASAWTCRIPGFLISLRAIFSSVRLETPDPRETSDQRPLVSPSLPITKS